MSYIWRLPQGITDLSPSQSNQLHQLSYQLITHYQQQGYQFVSPPIAEYELSHFYGQDKAFRVPDTLDGQMLVIHSDITPQLARIDSKYCQKGRIGRYCYVADILSTSSDDFYQSRNPIQAGAESYGDEKITADIEIIQLMINSLGYLGFRENLVLSLGHIGIFNILCKNCELNADLVDELADIITRHSQPDLVAFFAQNTIANESDFLNLLLLNGDTSTLTLAKKSYQHNLDITSIITTLEHLVQSLAVLEVQIHIDLATPKDKAYHTGLLFACYHQDFSKALAKGGRYDGLKQALGHYRAATGFSLDLKFLSTVQVS